MSKQEKEPNLGDRRLNRQCKSCGQDVYDVYTVKYGYGDHETFLWEQEHHDCIKYLSEKIRQLEIKLKLIHSL